MKSNKDYIEEENQKRIDQLLQKSDISKFIDMTEDKEKTDIEAELALDSEKDYTYPGLLKLHMDSMKMHLFMELKAPVNSTNEITMEEIKDKVAAFGSHCESQVNWDLIHDRYTRIMFDGELIPEFKIASGKPVSFTIPEHIVLREGYITSFAPIILEEYKVDFHHIQSFLIVAKNEHLGEYVPTKQGVNGMNLLGKEIIAPIKRVNNHKIGENIMVRSGRLFSKIDGSLKIVNDVVMVDPVLEVPNSVDYETGDIQFKGDVSVRGSIREGFKVSTEGDLLVDEAIEPTDIICGNTLHVKQGIIGSEKYEILCKNEINAQHIENANIKCESNLNITNSISNSSIYSLGKLIMGDKARLIGGVYYFQNGIITGSVGSNVSKSTRIILGIDFQVENKIKQIQGFITEIIEEINNIQVKITKEKDQKKRIEMKDLFLTLKDRLNNLNNYSRTLLCRLDKNEKSELIVNGTIYPGVTVEICHLAFNVDHEMSRIKIFLDKENGEVTTAPL